MASRISPYIDNTGLVFAYDLANIQRSYLGEPTVNLIDSVNFTTDYNTSWNAQENIIQTKNQVNPLGDIDVTAIKIESNSNSDNYFGVRGIKFASSGTNHTFSFWAKGNKAYNNFPINFGVYQVQVTVNITTEWKYFTVQTGAGTTFTDHTVHFGGWGTWTDNTFDLFLWRPQLELKSHATPYVNGTRSVTQGLKDLTGRSTIDLTNVSFDSNAQMTFDGTDDKIQGISTTHSHLSSSAIEFVVTPTTTGKKMTVGGYRHNEGYSSPTIGMVYIDSNNKFYASVITAAEVYRFVESTTTVQTNKTYHVVFNKDTSAGIMQLYVNGIAEGAQTFNVATYAQWSSAGSYIGSDILDLGKSNNTNSGQGWSGDFLQGKLNTFRLYGRTLSASEIQQNFNAIKGRYGL